MAGAIAAVTAPAATYAVGTGGGIGPMTLTRTTGHTAPNGERFTDVTLSLPEAATATDTLPSGALEVTLHYPGQPIAEGDRVLVQNRDGTVGAVTLRPATKTHKTFVLVATRGRGILVMSDFNDRLAAACRRAGRRINRLDVVVTSIQGNLLNVVCSEWGKPPVRLRVSVSGSGALGRPGFLPSK
jgi:hypothetical protein